MSWIKVITINLFVLFLLICFLELMAGVSRIAIGKKYLFPHITLASTKYKHLDQPYCEEMKTDVLLSHVHYHRSRCQIKGGYIDGEYVRYNVSNSANPILLTLGGSTIDGFFQNTSAGDTLPYYLADLLSKDYQIMSGGVGGYSSIQELYKVIRDAPRIDNLHTVISLNGINDIPDYHGLNEIRKLEYPFLTSVQKKMNSGQHWIDQRLNLNLRSLLPNLSSLIAFILGNTTAALEKNDLTLSDPVAIDAANRWLINVTRMHDVLQGQGVGYYVFLQPTMGLLGAQSSPQKDSADETLYEQLEESYIREIRKLYSHLKRHCATLTYCFDISDEVPPTGNMYKDSRHHNSNGNKLLSQIIANIIVEQDLVTPQ